MSESIKDILGVTMDKLKTMASADTVIGEPMKLGEGVTCIPVSKVSYGFASGGSDFKGKSPTPGTEIARQNGSNGTLFGGGGGAGMTVSPVAFLVVQNGNVKVMSIEPHTSSADKAISMIPELFDKLAGMFKKDKEADEEEE